MQIKQYIILKEEGLGTTKPTGSAYTFDKVCSVAQNARFG